ncbi:serine/threonine protein kinase [Pseudonocardia sulfidoxydans NBRC 16205]|uniref:non-specific serine/threonine protein kinase n=1 Tax=Pseudonocardia sulfidoxydans NBRC 16205 TaxID=1223511 RepID=A0A511DPQ8_9PSEU|nr:serine/threonine-protein kinase [Pseudonocardia sulfidoxydans]GEL26812.1 serine/threonine protein kinase [Pseudonocardia sulfidoxydans NBRC 16205]
MSSPRDDGERRVGGRYTLSAQLGSGAMGTVWRGYDEVLRRAVAIKELKVPLGIPEREALAMRERMLREARALGGLSNPHIITVYDVVDVDGAPLVVLEMLPSRNLATMIGEQGRLNSQQAAVVGYATAGALRAAHRAGITHRDVKPGNVLVADDGRVKLTDFGIARNSADAPMTTAGLVLGSPAYIAPEVAAGAAVTPAADLWGLGATLFAAIEGRPPYDVRGDPVSTITEVVDGDVPRPRDAGPVSEVIAALMVKDPLQRMPLDEVRNRLRPLIPDPDDPLYPGSPDSPTVAATPAHVRLEPTAPDPAPSTGVPLPLPRVSASGPIPAGGSTPLAAAPGSFPGLRLPQESGTFARQAAVDGTGQVPPPPPRPVAVAGGVQASRRQAAAVAATREMPSWWAAPLVVAGAIVVLLGAAGGWAATRAIAGQSPMSTVTVTTDRAPMVSHVDPLGFSVEVPETWAQYRYDAAGATGVRFVSPDGSEELSVQRGASADAVLGGLTADGLGVDTVSAEPAAPVAGTTAGVQQTVYRTTSGSQDRTTWLRIVPGADGVWELRLTVPGETAETTSADLFTAVARGFTVTGA